MFTFVLILHLALCLILVMLVLLQQGKGADMGAAFGGGSNTVFGAGGATPLIAKITTGTAIAFMCTSLWLATHYHAFGTAMSLPSLPATPSAVTTVENSTVQEAVVPNAVVPNAAAPSAVDVPAANPAGESAK